MKVIVIANQKGGIGKSTLACHVGFRFEEIGQRVAFINCEVQGNSCKTVKKHHHASNYTAFDLFSDKELSFEERPGITVFSGGGKLADVEKAHGKNFVNHVRQMDDLFDVCVIDTPPTTSILQIAPLIVADYVLAPIDLEEYSIDGVRDIIKTMVGVKNQFNPDLNFLGMLPSKVKAASVRQKEALENLVTLYPQFLFEPNKGLRIGDRVSIPEALADGIPVWKLKKSSAKEASAEMLAVIDALAESAGLEV